MRVEYCWGWSRGNRFSDARGRRLHHRGRGAQRAGGGVVSGAGGAARSSAGAAAAGGGRGGDGGALPRVSNRHVRVRVSHAAAQSDRRPGLAPARHAHLSAGPGGAVPVPGRESLPYVAQRRADGGGDRAAIGGGRESVSVLDSIVGAGGDAPSTLLPARAADPGGASSRWGRRTRRGARRCLRRRRNLESRGLQTHRCCTAARDGAEQSV